MNNKKSPSTKRRKVCDKPEKEKAPNWSLFLGHIAQLLRVLILVVSLYQQLS